MNDLIISIISSPEFATFALSAIGTVIAGVVAFVGREVRALLRRKLSAEQLDFLLRIAAQAVAVAEQTGALATGEEKKAKALEVAETYLAAYGIKVTAEQLDAAIEAAVFTALNQWDAPEAPPIDDVDVQPEPVVEV